MKRLVLSLLAAATVAGALPALAQSAAAQPVPARERMQQDRIAQGVRSGALTPRETHRLEMREIRTQRVARNLRALDGGRLTRRDRHVMQRVLNRDSRAIHRMKHNARVG